MPDSGAHGVSDYSGSVAPHSHNADRASGASAKSSLLDARSSECEAPSTTSPTLRAWSSGPGAANSGSQSTTPPSGTRAAEAAGGQDGANQRGSWGLSQQKDLPTLLNAARAVNYCEKKPRTRSLSDRLPGGATRSKRVKGLSVERSNGQKRAARRRAKMSSPLSRVYSAPALKRGVKKKRVPTPHWSSEPMPL